MAKVKRKAGKKAAPRKTARKAVAPQAPQAPVGQDEFAQACKEGRPRVAHVSKGGDTLPVQIKDQQHLAKLREEYGEANVVVQS